MLADISGLPGKNSKERAMYLLNKSSVACVPGEAFYHDSSGEEVARFCFAKDDTVLEEGCKRIAGLRLETGGSDKLSIGVGSWLMRYFHDKMLHGILFFTICLLI